MKEIARFFGRRNHLLGILTEPGDASPGRPGIVILNAGILHRVGPSRMGTTTARALATHGYRALRFDLSGIGDSVMADGDSLAEVVRKDVEDAISLMVEAGTDGVVLLGLCAGADNAFHVAASDERVRGVVLIDPTVHRTRGFRIRRFAGQLRDAEAWKGMLSGRTLLRWIRPPRPDPVRRPPDYYGLLVSGPSEARTQAAEMTRRGVRFLYVLTGGVLGYCNSPRQVSESMPGAFGENLQVEWRPEADHLLTRSADRDWLYETVLEWIQSVSSDRRADVQTSSTTSRALSTR